MGNAPDKSLTLNGDVPSEKLEMANELLKAVQEIQISQRFMLKRLNEIYHTADGQCSCARKQEQYRKEIGELEFKVKELENAIDEKDRFKKEREKEYQELKERIELLETFVITLQTDDSKIHSASLKKVKAELLENGQIATEKVQQNSELHDADKQQTELDRLVGQVYHAHDIEYSEPAIDKNSDDSRKSPLSEKDAPVEEAQSTLEVKSTETLADGKATSDKKDNFATAGDEKKQTKSTEEPSRLPKQSVKGTKGASEDAALSMASNIKMVEQSERKSYGDEHFWRYLAQMEIEEGKRTLKDLQGVHTVVILDISASMAEENAWTQALRFLRQYLKGLEDISTQYGLSNEHVALVTFGHDTKVQQRLTNKYKTLRELVENQRLGGPSPLYGGLVLALAAAGSSEHQLDVVNHVKVFSKVMIITDGQLTEVGQYEGPDKAVGDLNETKQKLLQCMEEYKSNRIDTYFVQVGKQSEDTRQFTDLMMAIVDGKRLHFKSGTQFSRRLYLTTKIQDPFGIIEVPFSLFGNSEEDFSEEDKRMIAEIKNDAQKDFFATIGKRKQDKYREIKDSKFPPIGSRVRRGPDWKWNMQDSNGPGTVTGHDNGEQVWVDWDEDGHHNVYRYGKPGYDVLIVDEPRKLGFGQEIAVGCVVRPGKDWTKSAGNVQNWRRGVVIRVTEPKATVRWDDGEMGDYTYSGTGKCEIEVCSGFRAFRSEGHVLGSDFTEAPPEKKNKNKNINV